MIRVHQAPEPDFFDTEIRQKGNEALLHGSAAFGTKLKPYWRRALQYMRDSYRNVCAYSCLYIQPITGSHTVDHYRPCSLYPDQAYEWSNFRLACLSMNRLKGSFEDVADPFLVGQGWFEIVFPGLLLRAGNLVADDVASMVDTTIRRLRLNGTDAVDERSSWTLDYARGNISFEFLMEHAPFIASEMSRQGVVDKIAEVMSVNSLQ